MTGTEKMAKCMRLPLPQLLIRSQIFESDIGSDDKAFLLQNEINASIRPAHTCASDRFLEKLKDLQ